MLYGIFALSSTFQRRSGHEIRTAQPNMLLFARNPFNTCLTENIKNYHIPGCHNIWIDSSKTDSQTFDEPVVSACFSQSSKMRMSSLLTVSPYLGLVAANRRNFAVGGGTRIILTHVSEYTSGAWLFEGALPYMLHRAPCPVVFIKFFSACQKHREFVWPCAWGGIGLSYGFRPNSAFFFLSWYKILSLFSRISIQEVQAVHEILPHTVISSASPHTNIHIA